MSRDEEEFTEAASSQDVYNDIIGVVEAVEAGQEASD